MVICWSVRTNSSGSSTRLLQALARGRYDDLEGFPTWREELKGPAKGKKPGRGWTGKINSLAIEPSEATPLAPDWAAAGAEPPAAAEPPAKDSCLPRHFDDFQALLD